MSAAGEGHPVLCQKLAPGQPASQPVRKKSRKRVERKKMISPRTADALPFAEQKTTPFVLVPLLRAPSEGA